MTNAEPKGRGLKWKGLAKTEYGYKRRCGGEDGRGVQEKTAAAQRRRARSMDAARHEKREQKTEYGYKRRCGGKDGRGVQEKTAARGTDTRDQRDVAWHEKSERKN